MAGFTLSSSEQSPNLKGSNMIRARYNLTYTDPKTGLYSVLPADSPLEEPLLSVVAAGNPGAIYDDEDVAEVVPSLPEVVNTNPDDEVTDATTVVGGEVVHNEGSSGEVTAGGPEDAPAAESPTALAISEPVEVAAFVAALNILHEQIKADPPAPRRLKKARQAFREATAAAIAAGHQVPDEIAALGDEPAAD